MSDQLQQPDQKLELTPIPIPPSVIPVDQTTKHQTNAISKAKNYGSYR